MEKVNTKRIKLEDLPEGRHRIIAEEYYSSYGANEQIEDISLWVEVKNGKITLTKKDGEKFYHGVNSSYTYFLVI